MTKVEASTIIDRPVEDVWKFIADLANYPKWSPDVVEMKQTSSGPLGVGSALQVRHPDRTLSATVIEYKPNQNFTFELTSGPVKGTQVAFSIEAAEGKTRAHQSLDFRLSGLPKLMGPFITGRALRQGKAEAEANVGRVKQLLESDKQ